MGMRSLGLKALTVSQLNRRVKNLLEDDGSLAGVFVQGEVSNFTNHYRSGHYYFTLKDEKSAVRAVMFQSYASALAFLPENGLKVLAMGSVGVFERDGAYQLYVTDMQPLGAGALAIAFEQRKEKLAAEGIFDMARKKPLQPYPSAIGVVTSQTGAVFHDICNVLARRWPVAKILLCPAKVQGEGAAQTLIQGLRALDGKCDAIIIGRGGGSAEDLWEFNSEELARAISRTKTPVISAVGHETDYTICDMAADVRAPTPSAAAELAAPSAPELLMALRGARERLRREAMAMLQGRSQELDRLTASPVLRSPLELVRRRQEKLDFLAESLYNKKQAVFAGLEQALAARARQLDALSPLRVLDRGYAAVFREGRAIGSAGCLALGDAVELRFRDGLAQARVERIEVEADQDTTGNNGTYIHK